MSFLTDEENDELLDIAELIEKKQFIKADIGKPRMSLVEPKFIEGLANILTFGAQKYDANNWKLLPKDQLWRYKDSLLRHMNAYLSGELIDPESGMPHLDHVSCNIMFLRYFEHQVETPTTSAEPDVVDENIEKEDK